MNDVEYEVERNKLIAPAARYADELAGPEPAGGNPIADMRLAQWRETWNRAFHLRMNVLWREVRK
jgi:hypothetical protein